MKKAKGKTKPKIGRPEILTDELQEEIVNAITAGCYVETAVVLSGIVKDTFYRWLKKGASVKKTINKFVDTIDIPEGISHDSLSDWVVNELVKTNTLSESDFKYASFSDAVSRALADSEYNDVVRMEKAGKEDWKAVAWRLERRFPDRWGRRDHLDANLSGEVGSPSHEYKDQKEYEDRVDKFFGLRAVPKEDTEPLLESSGENE
jgi:transposase